MFIISCWKMGRTDGACAGDTSDTSRRQREESGVMMGRCSYCSRCSELLRRNGVSSRGPGSRAAAERLFAAAQRTKRTCHTPHHPTKACSPHKHHNLHDRHACRCCAPSAYPQGPTAMATIRPAPPRHRLPRPHHECRQQQHASTSRRHPAPASPPARAGARREHPIRARA